MLNNRLKVNRGFNHTNTIAYFILRIHQLQDKVYWLTDGRETAALSFEKTKQQRQILTVTCAQKNGNTYNPKIHQPQHSPGSTL